VPVPSVWMVVPFVLMLCAVALGPVALPHWWESNRNRLLVSCALAVPVVAAYAGRRPEALLHAAQEYAAFVILLGGLYIVAGGVLIRTTLTGTPAVNAAVVAAGGIGASLIGTTGAAMILIRPLLAINAGRRRTNHVVMLFIFLVANCGGMLTPLGDPPLFLGYLVGVPFSWPLSLWGPWLFLMAALLVVLYVWDTVEWRREGRGRASVEAQRRRSDGPRIAVSGTINLLWLAGIVLSVLLLPGAVREGAIVALAALSLETTPRGVREANRFGAGPMLEVAAVFLGVFFTMIPALELLRGAAPALGISEPQQFFWWTGASSALLDNAPTYLAFLAIAQGLGLPDQVVGVTDAVLRGISLGAVCFGATTYIGNAPNFMVRAIAEDAKVSMPTFFGYVAYSTAILIPLYFAVAMLAL
jgi:Na+/H+ antiporter NhaD/arsenite permease-like protein